MAIYRSIHMSFWTDTKVVDTFTPEDKYFMLYLLTNQYTNLVGCYEISLKQMSNDLGYTKETIESLLKRFKETHKVIDYDFDTKEVFIKHWYRYNWTSSSKLEKPLIAAIKGIKNPSFREEMIDIYNSRDRVSIPYPYGSDTTDTDTDTDTVPDYTDTITIIINYLNEKINSNYRVKNKVTQSKIIARLNEGYKVEDFKIVIDKKVKEWFDDEKMRIYLRPETLFSNKFEGYLNAPEVKGVKKNGSNTESNNKTSGGKYAQFSQ